MSVREFEQAPGVGDGQGDMACCRPWGNSLTLLSDWTELNEREEYYSYFREVVEIFRNWATTHFLTFMVKPPQFSSVQSFYRVRLFATPWTVAHQASLSITNSWSLLKLMSTELVMPSNPSHPLSSPSPPTFNLSQDQGHIQVVWDIIMNCILRLKVKCKLSLPSF